MLTVKKLLKEKPAQEWSTRPETTLFDALKQMDDQNIGALAVIENNRLAGILTEHDVIRKAIRKSKALRTTLVKDVMTTDLTCVRPQQTVDECMSIMHRQRVRYLAVISNGDPIGLVSTDDILQAVITEQAETLDQLENAGLDQDLLAG